MRPSDAVQSRWHIMRNMVLHRQTIKKAVRDLISISKKVAREEMQLKKDPESMSKKELEKLIAGCGEKDEESCGGTEF